MRKIYQQKSYAFQYDIRYPNLIQQFLDGRLQVENLHFQRKERPKEVVLLARPDTYCSKVGVMFRGKKKNFFRCLEMFSAFLQILALTGSIVFKVVVCSYHLWWISD